MDILRHGLLALIALGIVACGGSAEPPPQEPEAAAPPPEAAIPVTVAEPVEIRDQVELTPEGKIIWTPDIWKNPPRGLPIFPNPRPNPMSVEKVELGRMLFFDKRLSADGTVSCASCHSPTLGFSNALPVSPGIGGQVGTRNAPTIYNVAYGNEMFWDGRASTLEHQATGPITNPIEMGNTMPNFLDTLSQIPEYRTLYRKAFDNRKIMAWSLARALAAFERTILTGNAPYDRFKAGSENAMSPAARRGLEIFEGKGRCAICHIGANFTDNQFHNVGIGTQREEPDVGRMGLTKKEKDWSRFKTPTLRNVAVSGPYMHDGSVRTLEEVVEHYDKGGIPNKNLDPLYQPLGLTGEEKSNLVAFLKEGLTREIEIPVPTYPPTAVAEEAVSDAEEGEGDSAPEPSPEDGAM